MEVSVMTTATITRAKLQSDHHYQTNNTQLIYKTDALTATKLCYST